ncbi:MAG: DNA-binding protein [Deltaproteobacteria bacterium]|nr:MAG: DNA-binding protein [Deltaproteobacteria bacterium]
MSRYPDWFKQAKNDIQWAEHSFDGGFFSQTCFIAQQSSEKALKAYCFFKGFDIIRTHSLYQIIKNLGENGLLEKNARELDLYYISARYPDALPSGAPYEIITKEQAEKALQSAREIFSVIKERLPDHD